MQYSAYIQVHDPDYTMLTSLNINSLQHAGIPVTDIAVSEKFYVELGFVNVMRSTFRIDDREGLCIMMKREHIMIELYQMPAHKLDEIKKRKDGHIDHIAFDVDDIDATFQLLKNASHRVIEPEPVFLNFWEKGCRYFNILGPDGERIEFNQILK